MRKVIRRIINGDRAFKVLFPDLLRPLTPDERAGLKASIEEFGVRTPVVVDEDFGVIDGLNRLQIATELGLYVEAQVWQGLSPETKERLARELNHERRQFTAEEQHRYREERVARVAQARRQGKSLRTIAEEEGVSKTQVREDLKEASIVQGCPIEPEDGKVQRKGGGTYPASRAATDDVTVPPGTVEPDPENEPPTQAESEATEARWREAGVGAVARTEVLDAVGLPVPESLEPVFASGLFDEIAQLVRHAQRLTAQLAESPEGAALAGHLSHRKGQRDGEEAVVAYSSHLKNALSDLEAYRPHASVCPYCVIKGRQPDCPCRGRGWVSRDTWDRAPQDYRQGALIARRNGEA